MNWQFLFWISTACLLLAEYNLWGYRKQLKRVSKGYDRLYEAYTEVHKDWTELKEQWKLYFEKEDK